MSRGGFPSGLRAVVTGAGSGLGRELARQLADRGARLLISDIDADGLEQTAAAIRGAAAGVVTQHADVGELADVEALAETADATWGGVDLVINNAGVAVAGRVGEVPVEDWDWVIRVNLWGVIYGCHVFTPRLQAQGSGYIVNVASSAGLLNPPMLGPYNVTKAGVVALSETLHAEMGRFGVHVSVLCPTFFRTRIMDSARGSNEKVGRFVSRAMDRSRVQAPEVAAAALDAVERGQLYVIPMRDGRMFWRAKRLVPGQFHGLIDLARRLKIG